MPELLEPGGVACACNVMCGVPAHCLCNILYEKHVARKKGLLGLNALHCGGAFIVFQGDGAVFDGMCEADVVQAVEVRLEKEVLESW